MRLQLRWMVWPAALGLLASTFIGATTSAGASAADPTAVEQAWSSFQAAIATATATAQAQPNASGAENQARAATFVNNLAQLDLDNQLGALDPNHPLLFRNPDPFSIPGLDPSNPSGIYNPDNLNYIAVVSGAGTYQLRGRRGNSDDLNFQAITGFPGDGSFGAPTSTFALPQLAVNPDGTYTLNIGQQPQPGNWMATTPQTTLIAIRETFNNWGAAVPDQLSLVRTDQSGPPISPSDAQLASAINAAAAQVIVEGVFWDQIWTATLSHLPTNFVIPAAPTTNGLPNQISSLDHFNLAPGQALVINVGPDANAGYQSLELADVWGQTLPFATHETSLNGTQAYLGSDGIYHFVISATDPGVPNWIDTDGHSEGFVFLRWQHLTGPFTAADSPTGGPVSLANLGSVLPPGTPTVSPFQRSLSLLFRDLGVARRLVLSSNPAEPVLASDLGLIAAQVGTAALHTVYPAYVL
jgi:hypothetical protein